MANRHVLGATAGVLAAAAGVAAAEGVAALADSASPVIAVGTWVIDNAPYGIVRWGIETFGTSDKVVLVGGILATLAVLAGVAGWVGVRRPALALGMSALLGGVGVAASGTMRGADEWLPARYGPSLTALCVSTLGLWAMLRALRRPPAVVASADGDVTLAAAVAQEAVAQEAVAPETAAQEAGAQPVRAGGFTLTARADGPAPPAPPGPERPAVMIPGRVPKLVPAAYDRRGFLTTMGAVGAVGLAGGTSWRAFGGTSLDTSAVSIAHPYSRAPQVPATADFRLPGLSPYFTATKDFYRIDTAIIVPQLSADDWSLRIHGMVERPVTLSYRDLMRRRLIERDITLTCVSNEVGGPYAGNARWVGARIDEILREAGPKPGADAVKSTSADGWTCGTPLSALMDGRDSILAVGMNGEPLTPDHGFPVRMVVPGLYGFVSATKWVVDIEVTRFDQFEAYWTPRGWAEQAPIKTSARLEIPDPYGDQAPGRTVVAGVAWAQHRGISKVEVQVDDGPWHAATLSPWNNPDTWRQWRWEWDAPREHRTFNLTVRAYDGKGVPQTAKVAPSLPDGASGYHNTLTTVVL